MAEGGASGSFNGRAGAGGLPQTAGAAAGSGALGGNDGVLAGAGGMPAGAAGLPNSAGLSNTAGSADTAGAASSCEEDSPSVLPWPGGSGVETLDAQGDFQSDLSGLTYEAPNVLWAVDNLSGKLYRLLRGAGGFSPDGANGWAAGKKLRFPSGSGAPDAEGVTFAASSADGVYVSSERDSDDPSRSRLSVLRYDVAGTAATLDATREWNVSALLPAVGSNTGLEAITWVPDSFLLAHGFVDEGTSRAYRPVDYGDHGAGLFFVGVEETGKIYGLALNHEDGSASVVASVTTPFSSVVGLEFDRDAGELWFSCDDTCDNQTGILRVDAALGRFVLHRRFARPSGLPNSNNEGFAIGPEEECQNGLKPFYWTDDADADGFSLRLGSIPCGCL